jgi:hypothetical protein
MTGSHAGRRSFYTTYSSVIAVMESFLVLEMSEQMLVQRLSLYLVAAK